MQPPATPPPAPEQLRLSDLVRRRRQLVDAAAIEKPCDLPSDEPLIASSVERHLAFLECEIETIDQTIALAMDADQNLARRATLLRTIPGVGTFTAATLVAELPELGHIGKKADCRSGRRYSHQSGQRPGPWATPYRWRKTVSAMLPVHGHRHCHPVQPGHPPILQTLARPGQAGDREVTTNR
jgi:transposase